MRSLSVIETRGVDVASARLSAEQLDAMGARGMDLLAASPSRLGPARMPLAGRGRECAALDALVASVRSGQSQALSISGEAGIGKTALLEFLARRADGCRILRTAGVAVERRFEFAGLQRLCMPLLNHLDDIPCPQRDALGTAIGLRDGGSPDRFLVSLGVLGVLAKAAQDRPLICMVDDVQWLDHASAQALAFAARRAGAIESLGMVFATRLTGTEHELAGLPELTLSGLGDDESMALLQYLIPGPLDERVRDRMVAQARGNPRGLLGIPGLPGPEELAGGFSPPDAPTSSERIEETLRIILESPNALDWAASVLGNGLGRYEEALAAAEKGGERADGLGLATWAMVELVEAAARSGHPERAVGAMEQIWENAQVSRTDWALGVAARSMALLSQGEGTEGLYIEAIERLGRTRVRADLARAHLVYGEWLRRQARRVNARQELRRAYEMLTDMAMDGFAERARRELLATTETARRRSVDTIWELTAQEAEIARLAAEGYSNPEIGSRLFISMRTVEWHLRKVFRKLGVSSRRELRAALAQAV
jgi:DNA-binding CsgD family transcriptional regulator